MEKIASITQEQLDSLRKAKNTARVFKRLVGVDPSVKCSVGDTLLNVSDAKLLEVFKNTFKGRDFYYIVVAEVDEYRAFTYSLYPLL